MTLKVFGREHCYLDSAVIKTAPRKEKEKKGGGGELKTPCFARASSSVRLRRAKFLAAEESEKIKKIKNDRV